MAEKATILSLTSKEYGAFITEHLGKGTQHACHLYQEWMQYGSFTGKDPSFNNAQKLLNDIISLTDFSTLTLKEKQEDQMTGKIFFKTADGLIVESVLIPMKAGWTLCVSSQVGCKMGCTFCETGRMGLIRHLSCSEIISQVFVARTLCKCPIRNIVFMGMGEPFDNFESVWQAFRVLTDPLGMGFGPNHITLSTSGRVDGIEKLIHTDGPLPHLAVSLNAPNDALRTTLMPINRKIPLAQLYEAMKRFCDTKGKEILVGYVMMRGINDSLEHAAELAQFLKGLLVRINLIPYNAQSHERYAPSSHEVIQQFAAELIARGYITLIRHTKGDKIMAACGQLGDLNLKKINTIYHK